MPLPQTPTDSGRTRPVIPLLLPLLSMLVAACGTGDASPLETARERGLRAGFAIEPPYAFVDSAGMVTGEAPEILRLAAAGAGIRDIEWLPLEFPELIPALLRGRIDVIAAGLFITPERREQVIFSRPTVCVAPVLVTRGPPCRSCRIAVLAGSVEHAALQVANPSGGDVVVLPDLATAVAAVRGGSADALAISAPTGRDVAAAEDLTVVPHPFPERVARAASGCAALAFRPDDEELVAALDSVLARFVGTPDHRRLSARFGFIDSELPCPSARGATSNPPPGCVPQRSRR